MFKKLTLWLEKSFIEQVKIIAIKKEMSSSRFIRLVVEEYIKKEGL